MAKYRATFTFTDSIDGLTSRTYEGDFIDNATAVAATATLRAALIAISTAALIRQELAEVLDIASAPEAGSRVFERVAATVHLVGGKKYAINVPAPKAAIMAGNALQSDAALWTTFTNNFVAGTGFTLSDGDVIDAAKGQTGTISGKRVFVRSGSTNLPT